MKQRASSSGLTRNTEKRIIHMEINADKFQLAIDSGEHPIDSRTDNYQIFLQMLEQSSHCIDIFSLQLDNQLYNTTDIISQLQRLIRHNPHARIRLLLRNPRHLITHGHRIIELSRRLSSYIEIRQLAETFDEHIECFTLFDKRGIIYRPHSEQFEGWFSFNAPVRVKSATEFFNDAWNASPPCHEARRLYL